MSAHATITNSRSEKKPFKVVIIAENGEPLMSAQLFTTWLNCKKNLLAVMGAFNGTHILVVDKTKKKECVFKLLNDGFEDFRIDSV